MVQIKYNWCFKRELTKSSGRRVIARMEGVKRERFCQSENIYIVEFVARFVK